MAAHALDDARVEPGPPPASAVEVLGPDGPGAAAAAIRPRSLTALRNVRLMHALERIARPFERAGIPLMALKGAVLHLQLHDDPGERPMADLDLLVRPSDLDAAVELLAELGGLRSEPLFREDFFPRFYYEIQYTFGSIHEITVDLHVRPLRPLRLARLMPEDALWSRARRVALGTSTILVPDAGDMLVHLAAHSAFHGNAERRWLDDLRSWVDAHGPRIDWDRLGETVEQWHLVPAFLSAVRAAEHESGSILPDHVRARLESTRVDWRDRLALWHAPRDLVHMTSSAVINAVTAPGWRFRAAYLRRVLLPDRAYMDAWSDRHRCRWRPAATLLRCLRPILARLPFRGRP
ncbi:MAG: nucleotidyltransferase domain-containing protein [Planctomycetota bacterium]|jgi:hypothetical protein